MPLETDRLILREMRQDDIAAVQKYAADPQVYKYMLWGPNTLADTTLYVQGVLEQQRKQPRMDWTFALTLRGGDDQLLGACRMQIIHPDNKEGAIGYVLNRLHWNRGYATEAAKRVIDFGFGELGLHRISATCDPANRASARVMEKAGMKHEGHLREHLFWKGGWRDSLVYSIIESDRGLADRQRPAGL